MAQQGVKMPTTEDLMSMWNASGLKQKIIFTFLMIAVWRFGVQMPLFGINNQVFANIAQGNNIVGFLDLFSGGALGKVSILALGIGPFITSSIIVQLVSVVIPALEKLQKEEGEQAEENCLSIQECLLLYLQFSNHLFSCCTCIIYRAQ